MALIPKAIKRPLLKILRGEEHSFEDFRGFVGRNCGKIGEPESLGSDASVLEFLTQVDRALVCRLGTETLAKGSHLA